MKITDENYSFCSTSYTQQYFLDSSKYSSTCLKVDAAHSSDSWYCVGTVTFLNALCVHHSHSFPHGQLHQFLL